MSIDTILKESRTFPPPITFQEKAIVSDPKVYEELRKEAEKDPLAYWEGAAKELDWFAPWKTTLQWDPPFSKWFLNGTINAAYNCLDRHLEKRGEKKALIWEGEDGEVRTLTYSQLHESVCRLSDSLEQQLKLTAGDSAAIYLPLIPEAVIAMLACARIGVTHSVIFGGFAAHAIRDRVNDAKCKVIFTSDVGYRRGQVLELGKIVDSVIGEMPTLEKVVVLQRRTPVALSDKHVDWNQLLKSGSPKHAPAELDSEHPLFILYTSGTTGKPKGIVHTTGGYLTAVTRTAKWVFDLKDEDIFWCTADVGWVTGHSYLVYGPLANGATCVLFEGALNYPHAGRIWEMVEKHHVSILYTAPTAIRGFMRAGDDHPNRFNMNSLRLLGSVGEPINPEAWMWYYQVIGKSRCPIVDTWWQTETGSIMISPLPGVTTLKPGSGTKPLPGIVADIVDENGKPCPDDVGGYLVIRHPWPSMLRTLHGDPERFKETYWSKFPGIYFTGDGAHRDPDGYFWIKGRVDDVLNVSGHRLGTMEIESALVSHPAVAEAAVVGKPDDLKGQAVVAFVIPRESTALNDPEKLIQALKEHVSHEIGSIARPDQITLTKSLPKTRSGKIMRRLLKDIAAGKSVTGDTTTLENPGLIEVIETE